MTEVHDAPATVTITVNGHEIAARPGQLLIAACADAGVEIPHFCYHPRMEPVGMCRMCLVEVDTGRGPALQPSCMLPVSDGMVVETETPRVVKAQDGVLEFLLVNHPLDCPVCDKGGECPLQDQTMAYGPGESRFVEEKRHHEKPIAISDTVYLDRERCILCDRCTRFARDVAGDPLIHFIDRGNDTQVNTFPDEPFASYFSGNTVQICPVGALTARPYRFKARPWDLEETVSTAWVDSVGSRIAVQSSRNTVVRLLGLDCDAVNWGWLDDKTRFGFEALASPDRLRAPLVRGADGLAPTGWATALARVTDALGGAEPTRVALIGGARLTTEAQYAWARLLKGVVGTDNVDAQLDDGLPADLVTALPRATIDETCRPGGTIVVVGSDPREELGALFLRLRHAVVHDGATLVEITPAATGLSGVARHRLHPRPGEIGVLARALVAAAAGSAPDGDVAGVPAADVAAVAGLLDGGATVVLGRGSLAESVAPTVDAAVALASLPGVRFLSASRRGNVHGALDAGLTPGRLPGRVPLDEPGAVADRWGSVPTRRGLDTAGILAAAAAGGIDTLILLGADPLTDCPDRDLAERGLEGAGTVVAVAPWLDDSAAAHADVVLAAAAPTEVDGTFTNLEGRLSVCRQKVTPPGTARADWVLAVELARRLGHDWPVDTLDELRAEMAAVAPRWAPIVSGLDDPAGEIEGVLVDAPLTPLPEATGVEPVNDAYSLRLVVSRTLYDDGVMLRHCPSSRGLVRPAVVRLSVADAERLGAVDGTRVRIRSERGELELPVRIDAGVPRGTAVVPHAAPDAPVNRLVDRDAVVTDVRVDLA